MTDESTADDEALYGVWDRLTARQVDALHVLVDWLGARWDERQSGDCAYPFLVLVLIARHLDAFDLGHLPFVRAILDEQAA